MTEPAWNKHSPPADPIALLHIEALSQPEVAVFVGDAFVGDSAWLAIIAEGGRFLEPTVGLVRVWNVP
ncbi:hypothetical protein BP5796_04063 [Coleophoma crateriformis]|uniref:Uncharacterized protein n=1 Tax=Coleophoma crateriformis TaxID=565419 RepID=A0A3D8SIX2_9HELO|nr:hypothetical protein BP5796_04063 [Coleophoma crateriformis]